MRIRPGARPRLALRWFASGGVLCLAVAAAATVLALRTDSGRLSATTPGTLMTALREPSGGYSGTLVAQMSLDLPVSGDGAAGRSPILLMAGAHTMRYWYGGIDRQRVALVEASSEADVFYTGTSVWQWDSATNVATRSSLPPTDTTALGAPVFPAPLTYAALTPEQLTRRSIAAVDAGTRATVAAGPRIADRPTYRLTLRPADRDATRIAAVDIEVDAAHKVPLGVQVYARGQRQPSIDVSFSAITYRMPAADYFRFSPPPDATVRRGVQPQLVRAQHGAVAAATEFAATAETGWSAITAFQLTDGDAPHVAGSLRAVMQPVSGDWGRGYLLDTPLLCLLVTQDGRVLTGSVDPAALYAAAS